jgi:hypothetical protein
VLGAPEVELAAGRGRIRDAQQRRRAQIDPAGPDAALRPEQLDVVGAGPELRAGAGALAVDQHFVARSHAVDLERLVPRRNAAVAGAVAAHAGRPRAFELAGALGQLSLGGEVAFGASRPGLRLERVAFCRPPARLRQLGVRREQPIQTLEAGRRLRRHGSGFLEQRLDFARYAVVVDRRVYLGRGHRPIATVGCPLLELGVSVCGPDGRSQPKHDEGREHARLA